jgi:hypothetical protein
MTASGQLGFGFDEGALALAAEAAAAKARKPKAAKPVAASLCRAFRSARRQP